MAPILPETIKLLLPDGAVKRIRLEDYLRGVVAATLPADAPLAAGEALAVAARTFAANTHRHLERDADLCTTRHCQAWSDRANPRASRAVLETRGQVAFYDGQLIEAFYFEHCDGKTRDGAGVLLHAPPYLKSVGCPCGSATVKGHGVGMCLRGMLALARLGESYDRILRHYYTGIALEQSVIEEAERAPRTTPLRRSSRIKIEQERFPTDDSARPAVEKGEPHVAPEKAPPARTPKPEVDKPAREQERKPEVEKPAREPEAKPRRVARPVRGPRTAKLEQAAPPAAAQAPAEPTPAAAETQALPPAAEVTPPPVAAAPLPPPEPLITSERGLAADADDLMAFLALEDTSPPPAPTPPPSMPEELPTALELEFIAAPSSMPEDLLGPPPGDMTAAPAAHAIEPDLQEFIPPVERFYTPLDAPPSMPESLPSFNTVRADETPISWAAPPPLHEEPTVKKPQVLVDVLPGPRIIAGNLPHPGMLITVRDARGNSVITVSGVARQYGPGGFEAPLTEDGAFSVRFAETELDVKLQNETVFIYYQ